MTYFPPPHSSSTIELNMNEAFEYCRENPFATHTASIPILELSRSNTTDTPPAEGLTISLRAASGAVVWRTLVPSFSPNETLTFAPNTTYPDVSLHLDIEYSGTVAAYDFTMGVYIQFTPVLGTDDPVVRLLDAERVPYVTPLGVRYASAHFSDVVSGGGFGSSYNGVLECKGGSDSEIAFQVNSGRVLVIGSDTVVSAVQYGVEEAEFSANCLAGSWMLISCESGDSPDAHTSCDLSWKGPTSSTNAMGIKAIVLIIAGCVVALVVAGGIIYTLLKRKTPNGATERTPLNRSHLDESES